MQGERSEVELVAHNSLAVDEIRKKRTNQV